jgi:hypothetical protein
MAKSFPVKRFSFKIAVVSALPIPALIALSTTPKAIAHPIPKASTIAQPAPKTKTCAWKMAQPSVRKTAPKLPATWQALLQDANAAIALIQTPEKITIQPGFDISDAVGGEREQGTAIATQCWKDF